MNLVKSLFIAVAPLWLIFLVGFGIMLWIQIGHELLSIAIILSSLPLLLFFGYLFLSKKMVKTSAHMPFVLTPSLLGYAITFVLFLISGQTLSYMVLMMYALSGFMVTFLYVFWYSDNKRLPAALLANGEMLPSFALVDDSGESISSQQFFGRKTLMFFYRGNWCPLCTAQIDELLEHYQRFTQHNINVVFISPQSLHNTQKMAKKFDLSWQFYQDKDNQAAQQLGIVHQYGLPMGLQALGYQSDSVYPTVVAIDEQGVIIYNDQTSNYRLRPEPQTLFEVFSI